VSTAACAEGEPESKPHRLTIQAGGDVVRAGALAGVFGGGRRAVLRVERDGILVEELLLLRVRHRIVAVVNKCPHLGRSLDDARLRGRVLTCRGHGRSYSVRAGRAVGTPRLGGPPRLRRAAAWTEDDQVFVDLGGVEPPG
jgi:nitrite reductase/ring-hydroxylating ferredoxin subunit